MERLERIRPEERQGSRVSDDGGLAQAYFGGLRNDGVTEDAMQRKRTFASRAQGSWIMNEKVLAQMLNTTGDSQKLEERIPDF